MRILALALGVPFPPIGGGLTRTFHLLRSLAAHHEIVLAAFTYGEAPDAPPFPVQVEPAEWQWSSDYQQMNGADVAAGRRAWRRLTFGSNDPWFVGVMDAAPMQDVLARITRTRFDLVLLEGTAMATFLPALPPDVPRVLDLLDVHSVVTRRALQQADAADREARARDADRTLAFERRAVAACRACVVVSTGDAEAARRLLDAADVHVVPNGVDTSYFTPAAGPREPGAVLFTGRMSYAPNVEAVLHFATRVLPLIRREIPRARLHVVGDGPPAEVEALASEAVVVHGRVDDVRVHQRTAEVVVVPVVSGGGTRLKVLEAAASGNAVVTTPLGVEGLAFQPGRDLRVAASDSDFAAAVVALLRDEAERRALGSRARAVACGYDWAGIGESFRGVVEGAARHG